MDKSFYRTENNGSVSIQGVDEQTFCMHSSASECCLISRLMTPSNFDSIFRSKDAGIHEDDEQLNMSRPEYAYFIHPAPPIIDLTEEDGNFKINQEGFIENKFHWGDSDDEAIAEVDGGKRVFLAYWLMLFSLAPLCLCLAVRLLLL